MRNIFNAYDARKRSHDASAAQNPFASGIAYIEGRHVPLHEARIPILDEGFLRGDLTYDVAGVWDGRFFRLDDHLDRLEASCRKLRMRMPMSRTDLRRLLIKMVATSGLRDAYVEPIVTRGLAPVRGSKVEDLKNNLYVLIKPFVWVMSPEVQLQGTGSAIIARTVRRTPVGSMDPTVKNLQWGDFTRGLLEAQDRNSVYPFLTDGDGYLTEGAGFNIVIVKHNVLYTPSRGVLEGVTRKSVFDVARKLRLEVKVEFVPADLAYHCDEIFMCTTAGGIMPITSLDGQPVNDGKIGHVTKRVWDLYWAMHWDPQYSFAVDYCQSVKAML